LTLTGGRHIYQHVRDGSLVEETDYRSDVSTPDDRPSYHETIEHPNGDELIGSSAMPPGFYAYVDPLTAPTPTQMGPTEQPPAVPTGEVADARNNVLMSGAMAADRAAATDAVFAEGLGSEANQNSVAAGGAYLVGQMAANVPGRGVPNMQQIASTVARESGTVAGNDNTQTDDPDSEEDLETAHTPEQIRAIELILLYMETQRRLAELRNLMAPTGTNWFGIPSYSGSAADRLMWQHELNALSQMGRNLWRTFDAEGLNDVALDYSLLLGIGLPGREYTGGLMTHLQEMDRAYLMSRPMNHAIQSLDYDLSIATALGSAWVTMGRNGIGAAARELGLEAASEYTGQPVGMLAAVRPRISRSLHAANPSPVGVTPRRAPFVTPGSLPVDEAAALRTTMSHIDAATKPTGAIGKKWGTTFKNWNGDLPGKSGADSPFREYRVSPGVGEAGAGTRRVVVNTETGEVYYTWTHYGDAGNPPFVRIR